MFLQWNYTCGIWVSSSNVPGHGVAIFSDLPVSTNLLWQEIYKMAAAFERTSVQLYRDCLRLATRMGGRSAKGIAMRSMIKAEFVKNKNEKDEVKIAEQKNAAIRALSNYLLYSSAQKDDRLAANVYRKTDKDDE